MRDPRRAPYRKAEGWGADKLVRLVRCPPPQIPDCSEFPGVQALECTLQSDVSDAHRPSAHTLSLHFRPPASAAAVQVTEHGPASLCRVTVMATNASAQGRDAPITHIAERFFPAGFEPSSTSNGAPLHGSRRRQPACARIGEARRVPKANPSGGGAAALRQVSLPSVVQSSHDGGPQHGQRRRGCRGRFCPRLARWRRRTRSM